MKYRIAVAVLAAAFAAGIVCFTWGEPLIVTVVCMLLPYLFAALALDILGYGWAIHVLTGIAVAAASVASYQLIGFASMIFLPVGAVLVVVGLRDRRPARRDLNMRQKITVVALAALLAVGLTSVLVVMLYNDAHPLKEVVQRARD